MDNITEVKRLLNEFDSKHSVSISDTEQNINDISERIVKLFSLPVVNNSKPITDDFGTLHLAFDDEDPCDDCKYKDEPSDYIACIKCREHNPSQTYYC